LPHLLPFLNKKGIKLKTLTELASLWGVTIAITRIPHDPRWRAMLLSMPEAPVGRGFTPDEALRELAKEIRGKTLHVSEKKLVVPDTLTP
jgi:hypothetical protein